jgi:F-type H+-transporting ATPase subunit b
MLLDPHYGTIIWTIITFVLVLFVLKTFAWPQLLGALDERERRIREALEGAERAREGAEAALAEHRTTLAEAESEARQIVAQSREAAEKVHQDIVAKAREEAQSMAEQARQSIEREKNAAISQLRREMADLAVLAASALVDANLDDEKNRKLVDELIAGIPENAQRN